MKVLLKIISSILLAPIFILILYFNVRLYNTPNCIKTNSGVENIETINQLLFLKDELTNKNAGEKMQELFPEGFLFIHTLYGLSWCETASTLNRNSKLFIKAVDEVNFANSKVNSDLARSIFPEETPLKYGAFYIGWSSYLLGKTIELNTDNINENSLLQFRVNCNNIEEALLNSEYPYLESYEGAYWPADNILCLAYLHLYDKIFNTNKYKKTIDTWLERIKKNLDNDTELIPHSVNFDGNVYESPRGSSQSLMLNFLIDIDPSFAKKQFQLYQKTFLTSKFGLPGIYEYQKNEQDNIGDIDSGPVILDIGGSASIVGQRTFGLYNMTNINIGLRNSIDAFGLANTKNQKRKHLFGKIPIADAFIAWSNSINCKINQESTSNWRWKFQLISLIPLLIISLVYKKLWF